ncbi:MAG TPA: anthranilate synthase component I family protein [Polyangiaceae bacterium]|jgi:anthranilate synthase component 1|nr:anthranilate synthase component I family protein [Polyangiaceae bacterium]
MVATLTFVADTITPVRAYAALRRAAGDAASFLLESVVGGERWGRYSILGYRPRHEMTLLPNGGQPRWVGSRGEPVAVPAGAHDPLAAARALFEPSPELARGEGPAARFAQAHVGYLAWDLVHAIEKVPGWGADATAPLARFFGGATVVVFDSLSHTVTIAGEDEGEVARTRALLDDPAPLAPLALPDRTHLPSDVAVNLDDEAYEARVRRAQEYIAAGDAFQIVVARTFRVPRGKRDPFDVYRALRVLNPSPYMYFLDLPPAPGEKTRTQIAGASPETMVHLEDGAMTLRPIAGTTRRGKNAEEDAALERELIADPKERAEHVMLIDLGRNDVGRVAQVGTVRVLRQMEIERYSHVMHIVSEVTGKVPPSTPPLEVVRAAFPAGTLSGAPKVRAMQIIRELEAGPRGIYGGAIGYVARNGDLDFAISIRTAVCRDDTFYVTAGAGIVEASDPHKEAEETRSKARSALCAIETAGR